MRQYMIVSHATAQGMASAADSQLFSGWTPLGNPFTSYDAVTNVTTFHQALVK